MPILSGVSGNALSSSTDTVQSQIGSLLENLQLSVEYMSFYITNYTVQIIEFTSQTLESFSG